MAKTETCPVCGGSGIASSSKGEDKLELVTRVGDGFKWSKAGRRSIEQVVDARIAAVVRRRDGQTETPEINVRDRARRRAGELLAGYEHPAGDEARMMQNWERLSAEVERFWEEQGACGNLRVATERDYLDWLIQYLAASDGAITIGIREIRELGDQVLFANNNLVIPDGACGALAREIIVPVGVNVVSEGFDHCTLFRMGDEESPASCDTRPYVPRYLLEIVAGVRREEARCSDEG